MIRSIRTMSAWSSSVEPNHNGVELGSHPARGSREVTASRERNGLGCYWPNTAISSNRPSQLKALSLRPPKKN